MEARASVRSTMIPSTPAFRPLLPIVLLIALAAILPRSIEAALPDAPILSSPANGAALPTLYPLFYWRKTAGATAYTLQVAEDSLFTVNAFSAPPRNDTLNSFPLTNTVAHYWRVSAGNSEGTGPWSEPRLLLLGLPGATQTLSPAKGESYQPERPALAWKRLDAAGTYDIEVASDSAFSGILYSYTGLEDHTKEIGALGFGTYYWRARAVNAAGAGPWTPASGFTVRLPDPPVLDWPPKDTTGMGPSTYLSWDVARGADRYGYGFEVSEDSSFTTPVVSGSAAATQEVFIHVIVHLQPGKRYYWRVSATNSSRGLSWSPPWSFTTVPLPGNPPHLEARWDFEGGAGPQVQDRSGNEHHGAIKGNPASGGTGGTALHFDGESVISVPYDSRFRLDRFTVMTWVNLDSGSYDQCLICRSTVPSDPSGFKLMLAGRSNAFGARQNAPGVFYQSFPGGWSMGDDLNRYLLLYKETSAFADSPLVPGSWHHIAATFENRRLRLYVDGQLRGAKDSLRAEPFWWGDTSAVLLGYTTAFPGSGYGFHGWMDETRIFSYALNQAQIDSTYRGFTPPAVPSVPVDVRGPGLVRFQIAAAGDRTVRITGLDAQADVELRDLSGRSLAEWKGVRNGQTLDLGPTRRAGLLLLRIKGSGGYGSRMLFSP